MLFFKHYCIQQLKQIIQILRNVLLPITIFTNKFIEFKTLPIIKLQNQLPNKYVENQNTFIYIFPSYQSFNTLFTSFANNVFFKSDFYKLVSLMPILDDQTLFIFVFLTLWWEHFLTHKEDANVVDIHNPSFHYQIYFQLYVHVEKQNSP